MPKQKNKTETMMQDTVISALFIGHGSPMNTILDNPFIKMLKQIGRLLPEPMDIAV